MVRKQNALVRVRDAFLNGMTGGRHALHQEQRRLRETLSLMQRALDDMNFLRISPNPELYGLNINTLHEQIKLCQQYFRVSPLGAHTVRLHTWFTFAEGIDYPRAQNEKVQEIVKDVWFDRSNLPQFSGFDAQAGLSNKIQLEGNLFFAVWHTPDLRKFRIRVLDTLDVSQRIADPDDRAAALYFKTAKRQTLPGAWGDAFAAQELYTTGVNVIPAEAYERWVDEKANPDWLERMKDKATVENCYVVQVKTNSDLNADFGEPELIRGVDWIKAHKEMASDMASLIRALSIWAWRFKVDGGSATIDRLRDDLHWDVTNQDNPPPAVGSAMFTNPRLDVEQVRTDTGGAQIHNTGIRQLAIQVATAGGWPLHFFADNTGGSYGMANSMELPVLKMVRHRQKFFAESVFGRVLLSILDRHPYTANIPDEEKTLDINFPPPYDRDPQALATGLKQAIDGKFVREKEAAETFLASIGVNNIEQVVNEMLEEVEAQKEQAKKDAEALAALPPAPPPPNKPTGTPPGAPGQPQGGQGVEVQGGGKESPVLAEKRAQAQKMAEARGIILARTVSDLRRLVDLANAAAGNGHR